MRLMEEKTRDVGKEKHVPVIQEVEDGVVVKVGAVPHPMEENHYIEWVELEADGVLLRKFLNPGDRPEVHFKVKGKVLKAREYCNVHGLWSTTKLL